MNNAENMVSRKNFIKSTYKIFWGTIICLVIISFFTKENSFGANTICQINYSDSTGSGKVAPLAIFKKDADVWFKRVGTTKQKWLSQLPTKAELGVPVYPEAVIVVFQVGYHDSKKTLLPELVLASPDPPKKIEAWYAKKLKGWNHVKDYNVFLPPHKKVDVMSDKFEATPHVQIEKAVSKNQFQGMFLKQPADTKTGIVIRYKPD